MNDFLVFVHFIAAIICSFLLLCECCGLKCNNLIDYIKLIGRLIIYTIVIATFLTGLYKTAKDPWDVPDRPYATVKIVALSDNNMMGGRFYIRRGYFNESLYYQYMKKEGLGFKAGKVKADKTTLYYDTDGNYRVECYEKTKKWLWFEDSAYYYKIYIPEGSIAEDYMVDLQ